MDDAELKAHIDFETRSRTNLVKSGVYRYAEDPTTLPWGFSYRIGHGPVRQWRWGYPDPVDLLEHIARGGIVTAHNAGFERTIWNYIILRYFPHWPPLRIEQQDCTMARAAAIAHPQKLELLAVAVNSTENKDMEGSALMMKMAVPRKLNPDGTITWWDEPANVERLMKYCDQDVMTECDIDLRVPPLTEYERRVWMLDQRINDRGIYIDLTAVKRCEALVAHSKKEADKEMRKLTNRAVPKCSSDKQIIEFVSSRGVECTTVKKGVQEDLIFMAGLKDDTLVKDVIDLRAASKKTSTAKYASMLKCVCADWRIRGLLNYHGASTGRFAGRLVQPHNFPRFDYEEEGYIILWFHELLADQSLSIQDVYDCLTTVHGSDAPLRILSRALRSMITAPEGKKLVGGDFSNIEGRMNAWFADEEWKLQAFRDYDNGTGPDLYNLGYAKSFGIDVKNVTKANRQIGKVGELALGFQGSIGAYITMGDTYGLNPYDVTKPVMDAATPYQWDATAALYAASKMKYGLQEPQWTAIKILVDNWRNANPCIVQSWWDYQDAAIAAVAAPGEVFYAARGKVAYYSDGRCLWCVLPSNRMLCYSAPTIHTERVEMLGKDGQPYERVKNTVRYWGVDSETKQWKQHSLYGGLQCENIISGSARDVMVDRMFAIEEAGYPLILTVHDEILSEVDDTPQYNAKVFEQIMSVLPPMFAGLPLAVKAWEDKRYVK